MIADMGFTANQARKALRESVSSRHCILGYLHDQTSLSPGGQHRARHRMALFQPHRPRRARFNIVQFISFHFLPHTRQPILTRQLQTQSVHLAQRPLGALWALCQYDPPTTGAS
jgi:hypothetical protein